MRDRYNAIPEPVRNELYQYWISNPDVKQKDIATKFKISQGAVGTIISQKLTQNKSK